MIKLQELQAAATELALERGIPKEEVLQTIALALAAAYKKEYGDKEDKIEGVYDEKRDMFCLYSKKFVINEEMLKNPEEAKEIALQTVPNLDKTVPISVEKGGLIEEEAQTGEKEGGTRFKPQRHILFKEAKKISKEAEVGDWIRFPLIIKEDFGRIAAQTAKQVITQRLRELERSVTFAAVKEKEGKMVSGVIQRIEKNLVYVDLGKALGTLAPQDQIEGEPYQPGHRIKVYVSKVDPGSRGPVIFLSRSSSPALIEMFSQEVPEIAAGIVQIKAVAREAGSRSKIAVWSSAPDIDPIGSCVGQKGMRISVVINEFNGEKIDVIPWSEDSSTFIANALAPAKALNITLEDADLRQAIAYVTPEQQSLAIGKKGQNVRLAVKLTGWKIDIKLPEKK